MSDMARQVLSGPVIELFSILVAWRVGDDRRKQAVIIGVGTVIAALVAFPPFRIRIEPIYTPTPLSQEKPAPTQPAALPTPPTETPFPTQPVAVVPTATASQHPPSSGADGGPVSMKPIAQAKQLGRLVGDTFGLTVQAM